MMSASIPDTRVRALNDKPVQNGAYVLYWMQQSQREAFNHALEYAVREANRRSQGVVVVFGLTESYPEATLRHYTFMLEGLQETQVALRKRGIRMVVRIGDPDRVSLELAGTASLLVVDRGYLRHQTAWRETVSRNAPCKVVQVESDVVVPVDIVSGKAEYAARTIRPKIHKHVKDHLVALRRTPVTRSSLDLTIPGIDLSDLDAVLGRLRIDASVQPVSRLYRGGASRAKRLFQDFLRNRLDRYDQNSNQPQTDDISQMGPYLHFGQVSPVYLALEVEKAGHVSAENRAAFIKQLVIRRELAVNYVRHTLSYDTYAGLPDWAKKTLAIHRKDRRGYTYSPEALARADTHDPYWNAAMREMQCTGFMHNYMRMYWGKKILEWSPSPEQGFQTTLALNNRYFIDGRDPNSYAGVAWIYGLHDRAWPERPIFGKIRYMAAAGLERKCDIQGYVKKVDLALQNVG